MNKVSLKKKNIYFACVSSIKQKSGSSSRANYSNNDYHQIASQCINHQHLAIKTLKSKLIADFDSILSQLFLCNA